MGRHQHGAPAHPGSTETSIPVRTRRRTVTRAADRRRRGPAAGARQPEQDRRHLCPQRRRSEGGGHPRISCLPRPIGVRLLSLTGQAAAGDAPLARPERVRPACGSLAAISRRSGERGAPPGPPGPVLAAAPHPVGPPTRRAGVTSSEGPAVTTLGQTTNPAPDPDCPRRTRTDGRRSWMRIGCCWSSIPATCWTTR
jgi:hypothetical protein